VLAEGNRVSPREWFLKPHGEGAQAEKADSHRLHFGRSSQWNCLLLRLRCFGSELQKPAADDAVIVRKEKMAG
jgi:hypothetical protein